MVLDGQQRLQSLALAVGGDANGFRLWDVEWERYVGATGARRSGAKKHWSLGSLYLDLNALRDHYRQNTDLNIRHVDYTTVLTWVVSDVNTGRSGPAPKGNYGYPIPARCEHPGRYIRFGRLWELAVPGPSGSQRRKESLALLTEHDTSGADRDSDADFVSDLVTRLTEVRTEDVSYLELQPYDAAVFETEGRYTEAVVNIFTRLNKAGRTLSDQEISFAWIKTNWDESATDGMGAEACFEELRRRIEQHGVRLGTDDVVRVVSACWAVLFDNGALLGKSDLLQPDKVIRLATDLHSRWRLVADAVVHAAEDVQSAGLKFREHYASVNALIVLMAWRVVAAEWSAGRSLTVPARDGYDKTLTELVSRSAARWFLVTEWSRAWARTGGVFFDKCVKSLGQLHAELKSEADPTAAAVRLAAVFPVWLDTQANEAEQALAALGVTERRKVTQYYAALWVWNRLNEDRHESASVPLRESLRRRPAFEVDHLTAVDWWAKHSGLAPDDQRRVANSIGNCWLMESDFNRSKSKHALAAFLGGVHDFKKGIRTVETWAPPLLLAPPLLDPSAHTPDQVADAVAARTQSIRDDLRGFVRGDLVPVG